MDKKSLVLSAVTVLLLTMSGCGSSSSSNNNETVDTGVGYYVDSAVVGVDYICGSQRGKTGIRGRFSFHRGYSCSFSLAGIPLRTVEAEDLVDEGTIVETNTTVAQFLQSIDEDANATNGIDITDKVVQVVEEALSANVKPESVLTDSTSLQTVVSIVGQEIDGVPRDLKPIDQVEEHLEQTQTNVTKTLLAGKTFYSVHSEEKRLIKIVFNVDATAFTETDLATGQSEVNSIRIEGDRWYGLDDTDGSFTIVSQADGYIYFDDREVDGSKDGIGHRLYTSKADAQAYIDSISTTSEDITTFSIEWLNGRTLYFVQYDDFGYDDEGEPGMQWNMARMDFTENRMSWTEYDVPDTSTYTFDYSITSDGKINVNEEHIGQIELEEQTDDYLKVCQDGDCNTYLFFDESKAKTFRDSQNDNVLVNTKEVTFSGRIIFKDENGNSVAKPDNAQISIRPADDIWNATINISINQDGTFSKTVRVEEDLFQEDKEFTFVVYGDTNHNDNWDGDSGTVNSTGTLENDICYLDTDKMFSELSSIVVIINSNNTSYYMLQESDIAGHSILIGDSSKDKEYFYDHTYTSLESDESQRDTGVWSIENGKLKHIWDSSGNIEIYVFSQKPANGVTITNETYGVSGKIIEYK